MLTLRRERDWVALAGRVNLVHKARRVGKGLREAAEGRQLVGATGLTTQPATPALLRCAQP